MEVLSGRFYYIELTGPQGSLLSMRIWTLRLVSLSFILSLLMLVHEIFKLFKVLWLPIVYDALAVYEKRSQISTVVSEHNQ